MLAVCAHSVSLVQTTVESINGSYCEGILLHDLLHDYANFLSDQHYVGRSWIKEWQVWRLRLLESYCGVEESFVSSSQTFEGWWREEANRHYYDEDHFSVVSRIAHVSRLQNGQPFLEHSSRIERFFDVSKTEPTVLVEVCFTLHKSAVIEMHNFLTAMANERKVALSSLTSPMTIFAAFLSLRMERLVISNAFAAEITQTDATRALLQSQEAKIFLRYGHSRTPPVPSKTSPDGEFVIYVYASQP